MNYTTYKVSCQPGKGGDGVESKYEAGNDSDTSVRGRSWVVYLPPFGML